MIVYTDSIDYAGTVIPGGHNWSEPCNADDANGLDENLKQLVGKLYGRRPFRRTVLYTGHRWKYLFIVEKTEVSQYDAMVDLANDNIELPDGILCLAGSGTGLHGQRGRSWAGLPGNIHLVVYTRPEREIINFGTGFVILSAVSVINAIDAVPELGKKAAIKWVNDIYIDNAKVSGFLTHTASVDKTVTSAILGIGLNVETAPNIKPDDFVPATCALCELVKDRESCSLSSVFSNLINALDENYNLLISDQYRQLLDWYRHRSMIVGHRVKIMSDPTDGSADVIAEGVLARIGENLELYLMKRSEPITRGRLILTDQ